MSELVVIVPSRGRPEAAAELVRAFADTCAAEVRLLFAVDEDDPSGDQYGALTSLLPYDRRVVVNVVHCPSKTMVEALNMAAHLSSENITTFAIGFMGDDHRPRTHGWDRAYLDALHDLGTGIVYGDDLWQSEKLPTQCAMTADIVRALGWMCPPGLRHMYVDDFWHDLGEAAGCLRYLPEVVVEHMHPYAGKAEWDEAYRRVNDRAVFAADEQAYERYRAEAFDADVAKIATLRAQGAVREQRAQVGEAAPLGAFSRQPASRGGYPLSRPPDAAGEVHEWRLFDEGTVPEYTRPEWYAGRDHAPHLEQPEHRARLMQTATFVAQAAFQHKLRTVVDLGAGDGGLLSLLGPNLTAWGYDLMPANLDAAKERGVDVRLGDVVEGDIEWGQVAVCTEMLEHLVDPHAFVRRIGEHAQALVCSSPRLERPGSAYEFHTWAWDLDGYRALIEQGGFKVLRQRCVGAFQVILAVRR